MQNTDRTAANDVVPSSEKSYSRRNTLLTSALLAPGAGLAASLTTALLMILLRLVLGIPTPVELFGDFVLKHLDVGTFLRLLMTFGPNSKTAPLGLALLGMIAVGPVLALIYAALVRLSLPLTTARPTRREWLMGIAFALVMTLVGMVLFWNEIGQNFFGLPRTTALIVTSLGLLADFLAYGLILCLFYRLLLPKLPAVGEDRSIQARRQMLSRLGVAAWTVGAAAGTVGEIRGFLTNFTSYDGMKSAIHNNATPPITPNDEHYVVTQNPSDPRVNLDLWRLEVTGLVKNSGSLTFAEVQQLPSTSRPITLECIANGLEDHLISTSIWQGVTLRTLLDHYGGAQSTATHVAFYSVDGYNMSLPLQEVLEADALLAWRMNGTDIPYRHGYPMRVLIPGRYGEENPKWLTRIELTNHFVGGLYSDQGWYNGPLHTMSRIDRPREQATLGQATEIAGIAFAGNHGIQKVEVSTDGGTTWQQAQLQPKLSPDAWVLWAAQWTPTHAGNYTLMARATDGTGAVQTSKKQGTVPNGATGYPMAIVTVK